MAIVKGSPRAVIYTRVSTSQQGEGTSLAGQYAACAKRAQDDGVLIVGHFEETKSGALYQSRSELQKALALIESGEAQRLILSKLDRTGRDVDDLRDVKRRVEAAGAQMVFADGMTFEKGAVGNLTFTLMSGFAEFERALIAERMIGGTLRLAESGKQPNPKAPYGYYVWTKNDVIRGQCTPEQRGTYIVKEEEAKWVKPLFERLAAGESLRAVATWLQREGAPTRTGTPWNPGTIVRMIEKETYIGKPAWRKYKSIVDESRAERGIGIRYDVPRPKEEHFIFDAPALIDEDLWKRANETVKAGRFERSGRNTAKYMLTGYVTCPLCGRRMTAIPCRTGTLVPQRTNVYRCLGAVKKNAEVKRKCEFPSMIGPRLDECVIEALAAFFEGPEILEKAVAEFLAHQKIKSAQSNDSSRLRHVEREIGACRQREEIAATKEIESAMKGQDGSVFAGLRDQNARKRKELEIEKESLITRQAVSHLEVPVLELDVATRLLSALRDQSVPLLEKNLLLRPFVKIVYPRLIPQDLRVSAKAWRARGCPEPVEGDGKGHPFARHLGGCDIVLRFGTNAAFILSRHIVGWDVTFDRGHRKALVPRWETTLRVEEKNPLPQDWKKLSTVTTWAHKRGLY
ncbi:hypothetical protein IAD21_01205 [Abditibacteriota bacterium]|nr:hypothetical protein IAD21_01205 [Abditibacteriota bacterium]